MARDSLQKPERSAEAIRADLERARAELTASVQELRLEVVRTVSFRPWYQRHTGLFLLGAFTLGFAIGFRKRS